MDNLKNYYNLCLPFLPLKDDFVWPIPKDNEEILIIDNSNASNDLLEWAKSANTRVFRILIFSLPPFFTNQSIHVDGTLARHLNYAVNWIYNCDNQRMFWYKPLNNGSTGSNRLDGNFTTWKRDEVVVIDETTSLGPLLVHAGIPHNSHNLGETHRWCVSVRLEPLGESWPDAVKRFNKWIK